MRKAFTLVELMVSIVLVLVLMIGVSSVFKTISATVSAGSAVSDNTRVARAAQTVFARDFENIVADKSAPFISIHSSVVPAYRNRQDELSDTGVPFKNRNQLTVDLNGNNIEGEAPPAVQGERVSCATYNFRNHRTDILAFFTRELQRRQTGNPGQNMISSMTRSEAWVRYAHAQIWNGTGPLPNAGSFDAPDGNAPAGTNPNNRYATQFLLTRSAILLSDGTDSDGDGSVDVISDGTPQQFWKRNAGLTPLSQGSGSNTGGRVIQESTCDLAGVTMSAYRQIVINYLATNAGSFNTFGSTLHWRPCVNPFYPKPLLTSESLAQTVPALIPGCTQFIVEYAGDFLEQSPLGQVTGVCAPVNPANQSKTDGVIDYIVTGTAPYQKKEIRWYGLPRDTNGDGKVNIADVVPLRDVMRTLASEASTEGAPFEKNQPFITQKADYADTSAPNNGLGLTDEYNCVWTPNDNFRPKMIRITLVVDDPQGRNPNPDGQIFEYVFELP